MPLSVEQQLQRLAPNDPLREWVRLQATVMERRQHWRNRRGPLASPVSGPGPAPRDLPPLEVGAGMATLPAAVDASSSGTLSPEMELGGAGIRLQEGFLGAGADSGLGGPSSLLSPESLLGADVPGESVFEGTPLLGLEGAAGALAAGELLPGDPFDSAAGAPLGTLSERLGGLLPVLGDDASFSAEADATGALELLIGRSDPLWPASVQLDDADADERLPAGSELTAVQSPGLMVR